MSILEQAKEVNLNDLLNSLGCTYVEKGGINQSWYLSPFRDEKIPSFVVDNNRNVWYDHGEGKGGSVINFYMEYFMVDFKTAMHKLANGSVPQYSFSKFKSNRISKPKKGIDIISIKPIIDPVLIKYIQSRKIDIDLARMYCEQAKIRFPNSRYPEKEYNIISFENISGGYEFRNETIKLGNTPKDISLIYSNPLKLNLFEGFFDFLSALMHFKTSKLEYDSMILNTLSYIEKANEYNFINLYIDHGDAAEKAITKLTSKINDERYIFKEYSDFNDYLQNTL